MKRFVSMIALVLAAFTPSAAYADQFDTFLSTASLAIPASAIAFVTVTLPMTSAYGILYNLVSWLLSIFGFLGILGFIVSGIMYIMAAGDDDMIERAKTTMWYSIVGIIVGLVGYIIIVAIDGLLRANY